MNARLNNFVQADMASVFPAFKVETEITVENGRVQFVLIYAYSSVCSASIDASMPVLACTAGFEYDTPSWKATEGTVATVLDASEGVAAVEGQPFHLTPDQQHQLNELLEEWAEEQFKKEMDEQDTRIAESMAEGEW